MIGREAEMDRMRAVIEAARAGRGGALVLLGEAGLGKTTLLEAASGLAGDLRVVRISGAQAEHDIPFAGLHALLGPFATPAHLEALPAVQRRGLLVALGLEGGVPPGPLVVGAATLGLLAAVDDLLLLVDDLQWLDSASVDALTFAARRLEAESVALVATVRSGSEPAAVQGLPSLRLSGLADARGLVPGVHPAVAEHLRVATGGNPLALVEMAAALTPAQAAGTVPLPRQLPPTNPEQVYAARLDGLPHLERRAARVAAVAGRTPLDVLARALGDRGLGALDPVERLGMCRVEDVVVWRHPLARSAAARGTAAEVREAHRAMAEAWDGARVPARAWHLADAADGPDEEAASALAEVAESADTKDAGAEAADAWQRAASLVPDVARRADLTERAARAALRAGATGRAADLLDQALLRQPGPARAARLLWQRGRIQHALGDPMHGLDLFLQAVDLSTDPDLRVWAAAEGLYAAMYANRPDQSTRMAELVRLHHDPGQPVHAFLVAHAAGAAAALNGDAATAHRHLRRAREWLGQGLLEREPHLLLWAVNIELFDPVDLRLTPELRAAMDHARARGDLTWLPRVTHLAAARCEAVGDWAQARALIEECEILSRASGQHTQLAEALGGRCQMDALHGDDDRLRERLDELTRVATSTRSEWLAGYPPWVRALAALTSQDLRASVVELQSAVRAMPDVLPLLVDALVRSDRTAEAHEEVLRHPGLAPGVSAAARALLGGDDLEPLLAWADGEEHRLLAAVRRQVVGEHLRRLGRRVEARQQLRASYEVFREARARPWIERAEGELRASGATLRKRSVADRLTPSEERIARLVADGRANKEVASVLFLSPKTVEFHLGNAYRKLGVRNRTALARALEAGAGG